MGCQHNLIAKDGRQLFTVQGDNWNERLGQVSAREIALAASGTDGGGGTQDLKPITLREFLGNARRYGVYAGLDVSNLADDVLDKQLSIRFQTAFLPVDSGNQSRLEFAPEAYNYNTTSDLNPRNLVLLCTTQGVAVQQDGAGNMSRQKPVEGRSCVKVPSLHEWGGSDQPAIPYQSRTNQVSNLECGWESRQ